MSIMAHTSSGKKLTRDFYTRADTLLVARELLGKLLVVPAKDGARVSGLIVETEGYMGPEDRAAHSFNNRRTARTETMFAEGGRVYVFFVYGMHHQFNVVTNTEGTPHAVLIRALEPVEGVELMRERRAVAGDKNLTNGPGKLCKALSIDRSFNGEDIVRSQRVWIEDAGRKIRNSAIARGPRIGIDYAGEYIQKPWRFWIKDNPYVSRKG